MSAEEAIQEIKKVFVLYESNGKKIELIQDIIRKCENNG
jgi:hypothetical protein